ncbi:mitochondrial carrier [Dentipellis sp. KUC8613]|nr:mitochondrial carrier [Dentipellis sp. KUC8613]
MFASAVTNPLDMSVRQQLKTQAPSPGARAHTFWAVGAQMARTEGVRSLMNGFTASMLREVSYSGIRMGTYEFFKDAIYALGAGSISSDGLALKVLAATVASTIGSAIANPTDLVKVRMQAFYPTGSPYRNTRHAFASIWAAGGVRALYRGVDATTARGVVLSVSQICSYDATKQALKRRGAMREGLGVHVAASMVAGFVCSVVSNPVDVVKVRVMNDKDGVYKGVVDCVRRMVLEEGVGSFYKGFGMCWARLGAHTVLSFVAFERLRVIFGIAPM